nr:MAG TPA: hypothetical protein [Caudoviricetes sp.]
MFENFLAGFMATAAKDPLSVDDIVQLTHALTDNKREIINFLTSLKVVDGEQDVMWGQDFGRLMLDQDLMGLFKRLGWDEDDDEYAECCEALESLAIDLAII